MIFMKELLGFDTGLHLHHFVACLSSDSLLVHLENSLIGTSIKVEAPRGWSSGEGHRHLPCAR